MEIKLSSLAIVVTIFLACMITLGTFIGGVQSTYPSANLSEDFGASYEAQLNVLNSTQGKVRGSVDSGDTGLEEGTASDIGILQGTLASFYALFASLNMIDDIIEGFLNNNAFGISPLWFSVTIIIIIISVCITFISVFLRRRG